MPLCVRRSHTMIQEHCYNHISRLPTEILTLIFRYVRLNGRRPDFRSYILVCRHWADVGKRVAWESMALNPSTLKSFIHLGEHAPEVCQWIRSFSLQLHAPWPPVEECREHREKTDPAHINLTYLQSVELATQLRKLADIVRSHMVSLQSFSFRINRAAAAECRTQTTDWPFGARISSSIIVKLLEALPESCLDLELDTGEREDDPFCYCPQTWQSAHLCVSLRMLLPRTRHLRLRLRSICPDFFSCETDGVRRFINAPRLESIFVSLDSYPSDLPSVVCPASTWTLQCTTKRDLTWPIECDHQARGNNCFMIQLGTVLQAAYSYGAFPRATAIRTVDLSRTCRIAEEFQTHVTQQDIILNQTDIIPFKRLLGWSWDSSIDDGQVFFQDRHRTEFVGYRASIEDMIDCDQSIWSTTTKGDRWTAQFQKSELRHTVPLRTPRLVTRADYLKFSRPSERLLVEDCLNFLKSHPSRYGSFETRDGLLS